MSRPVGKPWAVGCMFFWRLENALLEADELTQPNGLRGCVICRQTGEVVYVGQGRS